MTIHKGTILRAAYNTEKGKTRPLCAPCLEAGKREKAGDNLSCGRRACNEAMQPINAFSRGVLRNVFA